MPLDLIIFGVVTGAVLGKYNVLILVPAIIFSVIVATVVGVARADGLWRILAMMFVAAAAVQLGYLVGITIRGAAESIAVQRHTGRGRLSGTAACTHLNGPPHRSQAMNPASASPRPAAARNSDTDEKEEAIANGSREQTTALD